MKSLLALSLALPLAAAAPSRKELQAFTAYREVVAGTVAMVDDPAAQDLARRNGLQVMNVTWEDTGRYKGSALGPNISDMTIQVAQIDPVSEQRQLSLMPVIRYPNFEDKSADLRLKDFRVMVGNEKGKAPRAAKLGDVLGDLRSYLSKPGSWKGSGKSLLAERDTKVLVSAQACFLPVPKAGLSEFNPAVFNYQSYPGDPAVLTLLATREGTSVTVIDNARDRAEGGSGQRLFFNKNGERAVFTGQRLSDFTGSDKEPGVQAAGQEGLNLVLLIQVPLKQKNPRSSLAFEGDGMMYKSGAAAAVRGAGGSSDVESAVIGHGRVEGPFTELADLEIERDERYPIRVTVQFYKATSNGVVSKKDMEEIAAQIRKVYEQSDYVGSLVVDGDTRRRTEHDGPKEGPEHVHRRGG